MPIPHKHAEFIKAWADGAEIQVITGSGWSDIGLSPSWHNSNEYRIKPAAPKWPQTTMTGDTHREVFVTGRLWSDIANDVLAHACETGLVVPAAKKEEMLKLMENMALTTNGLAKQLEESVRREHELGEALHKATMALAKIQEPERKGIESLELSTLVQRHLADAKQALFYGFRLDDMSRDQLLAMAFQGWKRVEELSFPDYSKLLNEADQKIESFRKRAYTGISSP